MPPKPFYDVNRQVNFFGRISKDAKEILPEEKVRQWVIAELMSSYGYSCNRIDVEQSVKIGSKKPVRIDVLIRKEGRPFIVIECKRLEETKHDAGVLQAISYANADAINAEFVVYTNGDEWLVKRKFGNEWVPVLDIPRAVADEASGSVEEMLSSINNIKSLLYWVNRPVPGKYGVVYFSALQQAFHGNFWCWRVDLNRTLSSGLDLLCRAMTKEDLDRHYAQEKLPGAFKDFSEAYKQYTGESFDVWGANLEDICHCKMHLEELIEPSQHYIAHPNVLMIRIAVAILQIATNACHGRKFIDMDREFRVLGDEVMKLLEYLFAVSYDVKFDDVLIEVNGYSLEILCENAWLEEMRQAQRYLSSSVTPPQSIKRQRERQEDLSVLRAVFSFQSVKMICNAIKRRFTSSYER